jgi:hypothetical protein
MTGGTQVITAAGAAAMVRCGVNLIGFDQLRPDDGRLAALVWSWAPGEPTSTSGNCAYLGDDGRFHAGACDTPRHAACVDSNHDWHVTDAAGAWSDGPQLCAADFPGDRFGVPPNGYRGGQVTAARPNESATVWLDYRRINGAWTVDPDDTP